ncbi:MAG: aminotransferase class III-fold pyridoxal phosphate-dependent enzyme, partial [Acidobacteriota bacterium]|nr:aminotransferase class III-fold pyridoxal phosphate-dependent enzyme [Acidobacteriota bacterium]
MLTRAKDQFVWDADGNQYLDFFGGILTVSVGHCNDRVNAAVHVQVDKLQHVSTVFATEPQAALAKKIAEIAPGDGWKSFFTSSGTEANETAIMAARCFTGSSEIIALRHSYHGRSSLAMGITGQGNWRVGAPTQAGITFAHNAYCYRCPFGLTYPSCEVRCAQDVKELIRTTTSGQIAGMIAEPIQGVGGFITPPKEY